jgi:hypothetical protein
VKEQPILVDTRPRSTDPPIPQTTFEAGKKPYPISKDCIGIEDVSLQQVTAGRRRSAQPDVIKVFATYAEFATEGDLMPAISLPTDALQMICCINFMRRIAIIGPVCIVGSDRWGFVPDP